MGLGCDKLGVSWADACALALLGFSFSLRAFSRFLRHNQTPNKMANKKMRIFKDFVLKRLQPQNASPHRPGEEGQSLNKGRERRDGHAIQIGDGPPIKHQR
jgi:hypothetical protein